MQRLTIRVAALMVATLVALHSSFLTLANAGNTDAFSDVVMPAIQKHCGSCHGASNEIEGDANLLALESSNLSEQVELIRSMIDALDLSEMPPPDEPPLSTDLRRDLVGHLRQILHDEVAKQHAFARAPIRRMNRFQYNNAIIDLFELRCIVFTLPERMMRDHKNYFKPETGKMPDMVTVGSRPLGKSQMIEPRLAGVAAFPQDLRAEHGFDNRGDHLSLSPLLMESFLTLGQSITQSPDFTPKNVGKWNSLFAPPDDDTLRSDSLLTTELSSRLQSFLSTAFRRTVGPSTVDRYSTYALRQIKSGTTFTDAMKMVAAAAVASPKFLYLYDKSSQSGGAESIDDFELASRLSFFLWGSLPDQELRELAAAGLLHRPNELEGQINRMLKDRKLKRFCDSFPAQWLQLERIISSVPDPEKFPDFYFSKYRDSMHMMLEPLLLFETVLIENQSITQLVDSDFTYRSKVLEDAYGELGTQNAAKTGGGGVMVLNFRRVPVKDRRSGGLITNAAVMTMTSGPLRSKPITRGAWVAGVIFNDPPKPPPADVPTLDEKPPEDEAQMTLRERLSKHRERADCRGCHEQIDPLGFALENFDAVGVWRDKYENGRDVDSAGNLFRQHQFADVVEFKDALLAEKDRFTRGLAGHLLSFSLARELAASDQPALDEITAATAVDGYKLQALIKHVIQSKPFLNKSSQPTPAL